MGNIIRASDSRLARIDVSVPGFLTREGTMQVKLPSHHSPREEVVSRKEIASSCLSLEEEIDQFQLEEEREEQGELVIEVLDLEDELDRSSSVRSTGFVIACITSSLEEEEIPLERKKGPSLRELLMDRSEGSASKDTSGSQLPPPPSASPSVPANLRKRKKDKEVVEEGELVPSNEGVPPTVSKASKGLPWPRLRRLSMWPRCALKT